MLIDIGISGQKDRRPGDGRLLFGHEQGHVAAVAVSGHKGRRGAQPAQQFGHVGGHLAEGVVQPAVRPGRLRAAMPAAIREDHPIPAAEAFDYV